MRVDRGRGAPKLRDRLARSVFSPGQVESFIARLEEQAEARHRHFGDTVWSRT